MNRREMFAALAATAVAGEMLAFAEADPQAAPSATPAGAPAPAAAPAAAGVMGSPVMGSRVFDWNAMVDKPNKTGSVRSVCSAPTATPAGSTVFVGG
jgi:hypothetical protein